MAVILSSLQLCHLQKTCMRCNWRISQHSNRQHSLNSVDFSWNNKMKEIKGQKGGDILRVCVGVTWELEIDIIKAHCKENWLYDHKLNCTGKKTYYALFKLIAFFDNFICVYNTFFLSLSENMAQNFFHIYELLFCDTVSLIKPFVWWWVWNYPLKSDGLKDGNIKK